MHFCIQCSNMYYIRINEDDPNKLVYYCRKCGHEDSLLAAENVCVSKTQIKKSEQSFNHIINILSMILRCLALIIYFVLIQIALLIKMA